MASVNHTAPTTEECVAAGEVAQEVVRKYFVQLCNAIPKGDVLGHLYASKLIDHLTFEQYVETGTGVTTTQKIRLVALNVERSVARGLDKAANGEITKLCRILRGEKDEELTELAEAIEGSYQDEWETRKATIKAQLHDRERIELEKVRLQLSAFKLTSQIPDPPVESLKEIIKRIIQNFVEVSVNTAVNITTIQEQLKELYEKDILISSQLYSWALQELKKIGTTQSDVPSTNPYISVEPLKSLGDSPHGRVLLVVDKNGVKYAAKTFFRAQSKEFSSEFGLLALVRHKNIVRYIGLARLHSNENPAVVMELMDIDLHKRILQRPSIEFSKKLNMLRDIAEGLDYLHTYQPMIIHRDLTAKNVLLSTSGVAKIADFGNSRMVDQEQLTKMTSVAGTLVYLAPEAQGNDYNEKIDIFSYGHLTLFIFIDEFPDDLLLPSYHETDPNKGTQVPKVRLETDRRGNYLHKLSQQNGSSSVVELVKKCLSNMPADRPTASQLVDFYKHAVMASESGNSQE